MNRWRRSTKKVCTTVNYIHFLILGSVVTGCILFSVFPSSLGAPIGITSSAIGFKMCVP